MDKNLTVYPISTGKELNIFSDDEIDHVKIMDMSGNIVYDRNSNHKTQNTIDIDHLENATYIVEVSFHNKRKSRSLFVKS